MTWDYDGKRTIVTGAASGMGRATAHLFADEGARVAVVDLGAERVLAVVDEIRTAHGEAAAEGFVTDVGDLAALHQLVDDVVAALGGIDVLVNNAGISAVSSAFQDEESFEATWARTLDVNLTAHVRLTRLCLPYLQQAPNGGRVVNIASTESIVATAGISAYSATKAAVTGLTRSLAVELGRHGVNVNCICPGPIRTGITDGIPEDAKKEFARRRTILGRYGEPEEVAHATLAFVLPAASYTTGAYLVIDGGVTVRNA